MTPWPTSGLGDRRQIELAPAIVWLESIDELEIQGSAEGGRGVKMYRAGGFLLALSTLAPTPGSQAPSAKPYLPIGLFFGRIEEGARIFTPARLLPLDHPEALGHQFPTLLQLHSTEFPALLWLGQQAGLRLWATLQRYPTEPDTGWTYPDFAPPPDTAELRQASIHRRPDREAPLPGLRAVLFHNRQPVLFIVDTRSLTLTERGMTVPTTMGLDLSRAEFLSALGRAGPHAPARGWGAVIFAP